SADLVDFIDEGLSLSVLRKLQMRVNHEVGCVIVVLLNLQRRAVRRDRFLPESDHRVNMRGHMPGVGRSGRDAGITARGFDPLVGERRIIVGMDKIVRYAWMLRVLLEELF